MERDLDLDAIVAAASPTIDQEGSASVGTLPPLGQRIAIARDAAFAFSYPHILDDALVILARWRDEFPKVRSIH